MPTEGNTQRARLTKKLRRYRGFVFRWQVYKPLSPDWNHDHCQACWARFAERPEEWRDPVQTEGWVTLWPTQRSSEEEAEFLAKLRAVGNVVLPSPKLGGFQLDWLCAKCFEDCRQELAFVTDSEHPQWKKSRVVTCFRRLVHNVSLYLSKTGDVRPRINAAHNCCCV
jgi:hypothetical protein